MSRIKDRWAEPGLKPAATEAEARAQQEENERRAAGLRELPDEISQGYS